MTTPAERYAAFRQRYADDGAALRSFRGLYDFELDDFQIDACRALEAGDGVLVAAPTGSGKTVVGEFAVHLALEQGRKCFYTTPIKALSNQKYNDLVKRYGTAKVGLLTGDNSVNGEAPIVVMTTEVLRNMLYAGSATLAGLGFAVMDEVHYLADRFRGAVWEEVIIHLPESVRLAALSATVSNAEEFGEWLGEVRGDTTVIVDEVRPVPLWQHMMISGRIYDLFMTDDETPRINPTLMRVTRDAERLTGGRGRRGYSRPGRSGPPDRAQVIEKLDAEGLLPAITFIFSRAGCQAAVKQCLYAGIRLTTERERHEIRQLVDERTAHLPDEDLAVLGYLEWRDCLERGLAAHHAGMLPAFKEVVEELFTRGLVKAVFATETLALGINMPARSVVIEKLDKWNGETHADLTPGEYTQLTGRAGRRGIDVEGHAVVLWQPGMDPLSVAGLASTRTYPLRSSFQPSYNMAVNLVGQFGRERARALLEESFAQFQADRAVVGLAKQLRKHEEALEGYQEAMTCHLGDFTEYSGLRRRLSDREAELSKQRGAVRRAAAVRSLEALQPGDVIRVPGGRRAGLAIVLDPGRNPRGNGPSPLVLTISKQVKKLDPADFPVPVEPIEKLRIPKNFNARAPKERANLVSTLLAKIGDRDLGKPARARDHAVEDDEINELRRRIRQHPCHGCDEREDHARWAERYYKLQRETEGLRRRVEGRSHVISRTFDRICSVLEQLGYLQEEAVTDEGRRLGRIYTELDLLTAECLRSGLWEDLEPAELAACVSALVFESRQSEDARRPKIPAGRAQDALTAMTRLWAELEGIESDHGLSTIREPDLGFAWAAFRWTKGHSLDAVLMDGVNGNELAAGDFVRWIKQLMDLLGQLGGAAPEGSKIRQTANKAMDGMRRGVVAYSSLT
ncbi:DEAD/DEAH box helicase [Nonomuraea glycinis]|uniref:DEAD/DEAH box helicase n=1 Tax=Nonomuraea glycinis TaxID=2047744 RepID=UPI002E0F7AE0|nr:DEAD/DEAH box helicase [Nonomuraea glycinis]